MPPIPCSACKEKVEEDRRSLPHQDLEITEVKKFRGSMFGGWEETTYKCRICSSVIRHTNDKNEFAQFWWFVE